MRNVNEFYKNSIKRNKISPLLEMFFNMELDKKIEEKNAIELGSGAGIDAKFLVEKGFDLICVDKEEKSKELISSKIEYKEKINFIVDEFENIELTKTNLIYSNYSLHFCNPNKFDNLMNEITKNINIGGFFVRNFFRKRR